jgi:hypothetical protein
LSELFLHDACKPFEPIAKVDRSERDEDLHA